MLRWKDHPTIPPQGRRQDRLIQESVHDPYQAKRKLPEPAACSRCSAVYHQGRWTWKARPAQAHEEVCPACHRVRDKYPAGFLTLKGSFLYSHKAEIFDLLHHEEQQERAEHPLHRLMDIEENAEGITVTTTDIHLPRRMGEALHRAYQGELDWHYDKEGSILRVSWQRKG